MKKQKLFVSAVVLVVLGLLAFSMVSAQDTTEDEAKALAQQYYDEIWNQADSELRAEAIQTILAPTFVFYAPSASVGDFGVELHGEFVEMHNQSFPDTHFEVEEMIAEGNVVAVRWTFTATHDGVFFDAPPTGNSVTLLGMDLLRVEDNHIVEVRRFFDVLSLAQQTGVIQ